MGSLIRVDLEFQKGNRTTRARGIVDTGAEGFAFIDNSLAYDLGVQGGGTPVPYVGVGGDTKLGFKTPIDRMTILDNPDCSLGRFDVLIGDMSRLSDIRVLVGEDFLKSVGATLELTEAGVSIACQKGAKVPIAEKWPREVIVLAAGFGVAFVAIAAVFLLTRD